MDDIKYQQTVMRLTAKPEDARPRLNERRLMFLLSLASTLRELGEMTDQFKRCVAYGKGEVEEYVIDNISAEKIDCALPKLTDEVIHLLHAALGMVTEAEEFFQAVISHLFEGKPLDATNLREEIGDSQWYLALASDPLSTNLAAERTRNMEKLAKRFPGMVFNAENAVNRDLEKERKALESDNRGEVRAAIVRESGGVVIGLPDLNEEMPGRCKHGTPLSVRCPSCG